METVAIIVIGAGGFIWLFFVQPLLQRRKEEKSDIPSQIPRDTSVDSDAQTTGSAPGEPESSLKGFAALAARAEAGRAADAESARKVSLAGLGAPIASRVTSSGHAVMASDMSRLPTVHLRPSLVKVEEFYADLLNVVEVKFADLDHMIRWSSVREIANNVTTRGKGTSLDGSGVGLLFGAVELFGTQRAHNAIRSVVMHRTLLAMPKAERAYLKLADILQDIGQLGKDECLAIRAAIVFAGGSIELVGSDYDSLAMRRELLMNGLRTIIIGHFGDVNTAGEKVQAALRGALRKESTLNPGTRALLERAIYSGNRWLSQGEGKPILAPVLGSPSALRLGVFPGTAEDLLYDRQESLITIAPPGSGKTQAQVLRNLLHMKAPAVVLDVKGDMLRQAGGWRAANVGPVHAFAPKDPDGSISFNPLDFIRRDPAFAYDDARTMADLVVTPTRRTTGGDDYFERRGRDMVALALLDVALSEPDELRVMGSVLDRLYLSEAKPLIEWFDHLETLGVPQLRRQASALRGMPERQREGVFDTARSSLEIWQSPAIERLSMRTTFTPDMLRRDNATLFLCVDLEDIEKYASVLRALIGVTVNGLCQGAPEGPQLPVTFLLDEMPRLGRMDVIERALDIGRGYGVRLWMFAQNYGQLSERYPNADGLLRNCFVRCYISPDEEEAIRLSRNLGLREGLIEGERRPLMEAHQLAGPDFAGQILLFLREQYPARLEKRMAFADPVCVERMGSAAA